MEPLSHAKTLKHLVDVYMSCQRDDSYVKNMWQPTPIDFLTASRKAFSMLCQHPMSHLDHVKHWIDKVSNHYHVSIWLVDIWATKYQPVCLSKFIVWLPKCMMWTPIRGLIMDIIEDKTESRVWSKRHRLRGSQVFKTWKGKPLTAEVWIQ